MPHWGYSITGLDPDRTVKTSGRELRVSPKAAREVCKTIKGMKLEEAKDFLEQVTLKKKAVPLRKYKKKVPHRAGLEKAYAGRYPVKAAQKILDLLKVAEGNAEFRGFDTERLKIIHAAAQQGMKTTKVIPRAFGRSSPYINRFCHVELVLEQTEEK